MNRTYDIAIIGGGMVGAGAAYHCARRGLRTLLVEKKHLASGGSGGNFGLVLPSTGRFDLNTALDHEMEGSQRMARLSAELDFDLEYRPAHGYCLLCSQAEVDMFTAHRDRFVAAGFGERFISLQELRELEPHLYQDPSIVAVLQTDEAVVSPLRLVRGLWRQAQRNGAELAGYTPVVGFKTSGERVTQIVTPTETISVGQIALTAGAWTRGLGLQLGANLPEYYIQAEAVVTEPLPPLLTGFAYWGNVLRIDAEARIAKQALEEGWESLGEGELFSSYDFGTVQTRRGNMLFGQLSYFKVPFTAPVSYPVMPASGHQALRLFPQLKKARVLRSWRSPAPFTPDHLPLIGRIGDYENVYVASGFQSAITSCHWAGEYIACLAGDGSLPEGAKIFDPGRFQGDPA